MDSDMEFARQLQAEMNAADNAQMDEDAALALRFARAGTPPPAATAAAPGPRRGGSASAAPAAARAAFPTLIVKQTVPCSTSGPSPAGNVRDRPGSKRSRRFSAPADQDDADQDGAKKLKAQPSLVGGDSSAGATAAIVTALAIQIKPAKKLKLKAPPTMGGGGSSAADASTAVAAAMTVPTIQLKPAKQLKLKAPPTMGGAGSSAADALKKLKSVGSAPTGTAAGPPPPSATRLEGGVSGLGLPPISAALKTLIKTTKPPPGKVTLGTIATFETKAFLMNGSDTDSNDMNIVPKAGPVRLSIGKAPVPVSGERLETFREAQMNGRQNRCMIKVTYPVVQRVIVLNPVPSGGDGYGPLCTGSSSGVKCVKCTPTSSKFPAKIGKAAAQSAVKNKATDEGSDVYCDIEELIEAESDQHIIALDSLVKAGMVGLSGRVTRGTGLLEIKCFLLRPALSKVEDPFMDSAQEGDRGRLDRSLGIFMVEMGLHDEGVVGPETDEYFDSEKHGNLTVSSGDQPLFQVKEGDNPFALDILYDSIAPRPDSTVHRQPPLLNTPLFNYQRRAVAWMLKSENWVDENDTAGGGVKGKGKGPVKTHHVPSPLLHPLWTQVVLFDADDSSAISLYQHRQHGTLVEEKPLAPAREPGGLLADEVGLGKTLEILSLVCEHPRSTGTLDVSRSARMIEADGILPVKATLIVAPTSIMPQWCSEITKHAPSLKVFVYDPSRRHDGAAAQFQTGGGHQHIKEQFESADIVVTTFDAFSYEMRNIIRTSKKNANIMRPFLSVQWWRVVLDEAQMVSNAQSMTAVIASDIYRANAWTCTGTPITNTIEDLHGLLVFLDNDPFASLPVLKRELLDPFLARTEEGLAKMRGFLPTLMWRHSKKHVQDELDLPPVKEIIIMLRHTSQEAAIYRSAHTDVKHKLEIEMDRRTAQKKLGLSISPAVQSLLLFLRQSVCHPSLGRSVDPALARGSDGKPQTMESIVHSLIANKVKQLEKLATEHDGLVDALPALQNKHAILASRLLPLQAEIDQVQLKKRQTRRTAFRLSQAELVVPGRLASLDDEEDEEMDDATRLGFSAHASDAEEDTEEPFEEADSMYTAAAGIIRRLVMPATELDLVQVQSKYCELRDELKDLNDPEGAFRRALREERVSSNRVTSNEFRNQRVSLLIKDLTREVDSVKGRAQEAASAAATATAARGKGKAPALLSGDDNDDDDTTSCCICLEPYDDPLLSQCLHVFCAECIQSVLSASNTKGQAPCPICRAVVRQQDLVKMDAEPQAPLDFSVALPAADTHESSQYGSKVAALLSSLREFSKADPAAKCIVFSSWNKYLDLIKVALKDSAFITASFYGVVDGRHDALTRFQSDPSCNILLMNCRGGASSGAAGLTLTAANRCYFMEPMPSPGREDQAIGRINRIGQRKTCEIVRFIVEGTIEEKIAAVQQKKRQAEATFKLEKQQSTKTGGAKDTAAADGLYSEEVLEMFDLRLEDMETVRLRGTGAGGASAL